MKRSGKFLMMVLLNIFGIIVELWIKKRVFGLILMGEKRVWVLFMLVDVFKDFFSFFVVL